MITELFYSKELKELVAQLRKNEMLDEKAWTKFQKRFGWQVLKAPIILILFSLLASLGQKALPFNSIAGISMAVWFSLYSIKWMNQPATLYTKGTPVLAELLLEYNKTYFHGINAGWWFTYQFQPKASDDYFQAKKRITGHGDNIYMSLKKEFDGTKRILILYNENNPRMSCLYAFYYNNLFCLTKNKERFDV